MTHEEIADATKGNSSFSKILPGLQIAIDSTSLGAYKECPRKYLYSIILGYIPKADRVHLTFGLHVHKAVERYYRVKFTGMSHDDAMDHVLDLALKDSWDKDLGRPWISDHPAKHRESLIRTVIWYLDRFGPNDTMVTATLESGAPAVELSFRFDSGYTSFETEETIQFCGHLDRLALMAGRPVVPDIKTTGSALGTHFFSQFSPNNQMSMYTLAGQVAFSSPIEELIIDGAQIGATFTRFMRAPVNRPKAVQEEWYGEQGYWLRQMEESAISLSWPMNDKSCGNYGGCPYKGVCARSPKARMQWLKADFSRQVWDPLIVRGDI